MTVMKARGVRSMLGVLVLGVLAVGCTTMAPNPAPAAVSANLHKAVLEAPPGQDPLTEIANAPVLAKLEADAKQTIADASGWLAAKKISQVRYKLATDCANAILVAIPDFQANALALRDAILKLGIKLHTLENNPYLLDTIVTLEYGPREPGGVLDVPGMVTNIRDRFRLLEGGCRPLGMKVLNDVLIKAGKVGLHVAVPGIGGLGVLQDLGGVLRQ